MPLKPTKNIWFNNELVPWESAQVHVLSYALHYGSAVFEGIRAYSTNDGSKIFRLNEHIKRLFNSFKTIKKTTVKVCKICPPIEGDVENVSVVIKKER